MSEKSPLFISAMELLGHAVELLEQKNPKKNKFVVLHLSNAVEVLLKDMVIDKGGSIFENNSKTTINIWSAFKILESFGSSFRKKPHIEILIDERNAIQHKYGYPSEETVLYYLDIVIELFRDCIAKEYQADFNDFAPAYFTPSGLALIGATGKSDFDKADAIAKYDPLSAVATAYSILEEKVSRLLDQEPSAIPIMIWHDPRFYRLLKEIDPKKIENDNPRQYFEKIRKLRNVAVHRQHYDIEAYSGPMREGLPMIRKLASALDSIPESKIKKVRESV